MRQLNLSADDASIGDRPEQRMPERLLANPGAHAVTIQAGEILAFSIREFCRRQPTATLFLTRL